VSVALRILVSLGLLAVVVAFADWRAVLAALARVDPAWVGVAVLLGAADRLALNRRWQALLVARGIEVGYWRLLRIQLGANFLGSFLPASVGVDALRIAALCRRGEPPAAAIAATLVDRATLAFGALLFGSLMIVVLAGRYVPDEFTRPVLWVTGIVSAAGLLLLVPGVGARLRRVGRALVPARVSRAVGTVVDASVAYRGDPGLIARVTAWTLLLFAIRIAFAKAVTLACGADVPLAALLVMMPVLWIALMVPITIGGFGVQEVGYVALLGFVGVAPAVAVGVSFVEHVVARLVTLPGALFLGDLYSRGERSARGTERSEALEPQPSDH
jgi:uncharacterized protein (TIRG00374 family)